MPLFVYSECMCLRKKKLHAGPVEDRMALYVCFIIIIIIIFFFFIIAKILLKLSGCTCIF